MWVSVGYDREKNLHWAERGKLSLQLKMDMALSLVHCRGSRALSRSLCYGFQFQSLEEVARPRTDSLRATDISLADKILCCSQNQRPVAELAVLPRIVRMPGRISRDTTNFVPHSSHVRSWSSVPRTGRVFRLHLGEFVTNPMAVGSDE